MKTPFDFKSLALALACAALVGCGGEDPEKLLGSAKEYLQKNDPKAAVIQLKNALQQKPEMAEARFLLGQALLDSGDAPSASIELRKALDLKHPPELVVPVLARALLLEGQGLKVIDQFANTELKDAKGQASLKTSLATAYGIQGDAKKAQAALAAALQLDPKYVPARLVQVRMAAGARDFDGALALVDGITADAPAELEPWQLKGDLLASVKNDASGALAAYQKILAIKPDNFPALSGVVAVHLIKGDLEAAQTALDVLKKTQPSHPQTQYFTAQLAFQKRDFKTVKELMPQLLKVSPNNIRVLQLAGATELYAGGSLLQAEAYLSKVLQAAPTLSLPRRMLVQVYLRSGQSAKALTALEPLLAQPNPDAQVLAFAGEAHLMAGDAGKAEDFFSRATKLNPADVRSRTVLAMAQLSKGGNSDVAFGELQAIADSDKGTTANLALISALMRRNQLDRALKAIDELERKQPDKPMAANLRGRVQLARKDVPAARQSFEKALSIDPLYFPAASALASLDLADKKPDDAKKRFEAMLSRDPKNVQALLALAGLKSTAGAGKDEIISSLKNIVETNPTQPAPRLVLIEQYLANKEFKLAAAAAQDANAKLPDNAEILEALGRAQLASGDLNQAGASFKALASMQPDSALPHIRLAEVQVADKNEAAAAQSLKRALAIKPDMLAAQYALMRLDTNAGRIKDALATAESIQKQRPNEAVGYMYEGDIEARRKSWDAAADAYKDGLKKAPNTELATKLHSVLRAAGKTAEADKLASSWIKDHPNDAAFEFYLGDIAVMAQNYAQAEAKYKRVLDLQKDNAPALNNLSWVTSKLGKDGALAYAEKANSLRPNQPAFLDTLAMAQAQAQQFAKAVETQKKAMSLGADDPSLRLGLAKIYVASGDKGAAKSELETLRKLGASFAQQEEVSQLLAKL